MDVKDRFDSIGRYEWPFKHMAVGDVVSFNDERKTRAAGTAHAYGKQYGMKFKTRTDKSNGDVLVKRIA